MQPLVHRYGKDVHPETTNIEKYCPVAGEALLFLLLENNYDRWVAEYKRKDNSKEERQKMAPLPASKFSGYMQGNGRICGRWKHSGKIRFNQYVDIINDFNKNKEQVESYNKALKKACKELKEAKEGNNSQSKKRKLWLEDKDDTPLKYTLPPGMIMESI